MQIRSKLRNWMTPRDFRTDGPLVLDLGMHVGDDTAYYLARGCRVVALEANPRLCVSAEKRFSHDVAAGSLAILNAALCTSSIESIDFHICDVNPEWSSLEKWRIDQIGGTMETVKVPGLVLDKLLTDYGVPHYIKCDIEGADGDFVDQLVGLSHAAKPAFVSVEGIAIEWLAKLAEVGYDQVQLVSQARIRRVFDPAFEFQLGGEKKSWQFGGHSSGRFGFDLDPAKWISHAEASRRWLAFQDLKVADPDMTLDNWFDFHVTTAQTLQSRPTSWDPAPQRG
jgi:FkbM family methyltransferase